MATTPSIPAPWEFAARPDIAARFNNFDYNQYDDDHAGQVAKQAQDSAGLRSLYKQMYGVDVPDTNQFWSVPAIAQFLPPGWSVGASTDQDENGNDVLVQNPLISDPSGRLYTTVAKPSTAGYGAYTFGPYKLTDYKAANAEGNKGDISGILVGLGMAAAGWLIGAAGAGGVASGAGDVAGGTFAGEGTAGLGGASGGLAAGGGASAADIAGLTQMGQAAGLSGQALDAFVASGGTMGSTAAGGLGGAATVAEAAGLPTPAYEAPVYSNTPTLPDVPQTPPTPPSGNGGTPADTPTTPTDTTTPATPSTTTPGTTTPATTPTTTTNSVTELLKSLGLTPATAAQVAASLVTSGLLGGGGSGSDAGTNAANQAAAIAADQWNYYKTNYQPLETKMIQAASNAGSPEEFARAEGEANAATTGAFDKARKQTESRLQSYGINPGAPAYQAAMGSTDLAEGATGVGARTTAANRTRDLAYSKGLDVLGLGKGIPAQSAASSAAAANAATNASQVKFNQNTQQMQNVGRVVTPFVNAAANSWFGSGSSSTNPADYYNSGNGYSTNIYTGDVVSGYAKGGIVGGEEPDAQKQMKLKMLLMKRGLSDEEADRQSRLAVARRFARGGLVNKGPITPHRKMFKPPSMYADGGGVGRQGMAQPDASNMGELQGPGTETSDSIPAVIDGQEPAALSTGEVVVNAGAVNMSGKEMLEAINQAGLKRRQSTGLDNMNSSALSAEAGTLAYNRGGYVARV